MKTNLINLMTLVKEQEMEYKDSCYSLASYSKNRNAIEVTNQQTESLEDNTQIFSETMNRILELEREINKNKAVLILLDFSGVNELGDPETGFYYKLSDKSSSYLSRERPLSTFYMNNFFTT